MGENAVCGAASGSRSGSATAVEAAVETDERAVVERAEVERVVVEHALRLGIRRQQDLKASVEQEAVDLVRADAPADAVRALDDLKRDAVAVQLAPAAEPGEPGADDEDVMGWHSDGGAGERNERRAASARQGHSIALTDDFGSRAVGRGEGDGVRLTRFEWRLPDGLARSHALAHRRHFGAERAPRPDDGVVPLLRRAGATAR